MEDGEVFELNYVGRIKRTGEIFDLTDRETAEEEEMDTEEMDLEPAKILVGEGFIMEGLEDRIKDMEVGEERTVEVPKDDAFGSRKSENIKTISKREFEKYDVTPRRGMPVEVDGKRGKILTVSSGRVKVDFNHPLAGRDLEYDVEVLREVDDVEEQVRAVIDFHLDTDYEVEKDVGDVSITMEEEIPEEAVEHLEEAVEKLSKVDSAEISISSGEESDEKERKDG